MARKQIGPHRNIVRSRHIHGNNVDRQAGCGMHGRFNQVLLRNGQHNLEEGAVLDWWNCYRIEKNRLGIERRLPFDLGPEGSPEMRHGRSRHPQMANQRHSTSKDNDRLHAIFDAGRGFLHCRAIEMEKAEALRITI